jgi:hypothetical protein
MDLAKLEQFVLTDLSLDMNLLLERVTLIESEPCV